ncbi:MAG TPA: pitrilysin family protein [Bryobacteraceae bacterium]|nr:pitrilysin family protein [Bryobacteraceae bacterium]
MRLAVLGLLLSSAALPQTLEVTTHTLSNGMKVIIHEDHDIPNAALYFFFKVGSRNEHPGATGVSHFFEHMMFNGAKKYGPKQFDIQMEKAGGHNNAYTSRDVTVYTDWFPSNALELMFDMEADRIRDLSFDPKIIESERGVVYSERRASVENDNAGLLDEQLNAAAYTAHPYGWPVVGWASDIEAWTMDDLRQHFRMGYAPNNCVLVATGDIRPDQVIALAKKYLEPIPRQEPPPPVRTREPEQMGERRVVVTKEAQLPMQLLSFHVPNSASPEYWPLRMLANVLAAGRSSRLYRRLVDRDQIALEVGGGIDVSLDPGQFQFFVQPRAGVDPAKTEAALIEEVERVRNGGIMPAELDKAKNQLLAAHYRQLKTIGGKANLLGQYEVFFGDYRKLLTADQEIAKVTAPQVQEAAKRYLGARNRTIATLIPEKAEGTK